MSFKEEVKKFLLTKGTACVGGDWVYGWQSMYSTQDEGHWVGCIWTPTDGSEVVEYAFSAFEDTEADNTSKTLLALTHVNCLCGKLKDVTLGVEGGVMELLHGLLGIKKEYRY